MAAYEIEITAEDVKGAIPYLSLAAKEVLTRSIAAFCVEPVEVETDEVEALPTMFRENRKLRHQFQMGILATMLNKPYKLQLVKAGDEEKGLAWCMDEEEYDKWASSHVMNQLERLKKGKDAEVVNKVFDMMYDYKAIELMLSGAIRDELEARNDIFNRAMRYFTVAATQSAVNSLMEGELKSLIEARKGEANG